jgi:exopolysaccharide production protein ExoY
MFYETGKRLMDIFGAVVGITIFSPLMLIAAIWIKLTSPEGPIFADVPNRLGKEGKEFRMYKFRSMIPNAHQYLLDNPELYKKYKENSYKLDPDPRLIKGAAVMRKYSVDELPQFFNVLIGSMSIVGPRAYYPFELEKHISDNDEVEAYVDLALTVKPGITGPWQIGGRSEVHFADRIKIDAEYAKVRSLLYDLKVVFKTPLAVISGRGSV